MALAAGGCSRFSGEARGLARFLASEMSTDSGSFTFKGREALLEIAAALDGILKNGTPDQTISVLKGAQVGMTTLAIGFALYCVIVHRLNVGYFLPDQDFADRFDQTRVRPAVRNARIASSMRDGEYRGASPKGLKEFPGSGGFAISLHPGPQRHRQRNIHPARRACSRRGGRLAGRQPQVVERPHRRLTARPHA